MLGKYTYQYDRISTNSFFNALNKQFDLTNTNFNVRFCDDYKSIYNLSFKYYYSLEHKEDKELFFNSWLSFLGPKKHLHYVLGLNKTFNVTYKNHEQFMNFLSLDFSKFSEFNEKEFLSAISFDFANPTLYNDFLKNFVNFFEKNYSHISNKFEKENLKFKFEKDCFYLLERNIKQSDLHLFDKFLPSLALKNSSCQSKPIEENKLNLLVNVDINLLQSNYPKLLNAVHLNDFLSKFHSILLDTSKFNFLSLIHNNLHVKSFLLLFKDKDNVISTQQFENLLDYYYNNFNDKNIKNDISDYIDNMFLYNQLNAKSSIQKTPNTTMKI